MVRFLSFWHYMTPLLFLFILFFLYAPFAEYYGSSWWCWPASLKHVPALVGLNLAFDDAVRAALLMMGDIVGWCRMCINLPNESRPRG